MKKALITVFLIVGFATGVNAQTRRIAHRAHSGSEHRGYDGTEGNYGNPHSYSNSYPVMVQVHLESGKDTMVQAWDSLANPKYLRHIDTMPRAMIYPRDTRPKQDIREMGVITHRLIVKV